VAERVVDPPEQKVELTADAVTVGLEFTVIKIEVSALHPAEFVPVTV
jgi:hypothetical protein